MRYCCSYYMRVFVTVGSKWYTFNVSKICFYWSYFHKINLTIVVFLLSNLPFPKEHIFYFISMCSECTYLTLCHSRLTISKQTLAKGVYKLIIKVTIIYPYDYLHYTWCTLIHHVNRWANSILRRKLPFFVCNCVKLII